MSRALVIVESPAKSKTIGKYLGKGFSVVASIGHVKDLPKSSLGVDVENNFAPTYQVIQGKKKVVQAIKSAAKGVDTIYLALDPDREGEAIAWHIAEEITGKGGVDPAARKISFDRRIHRILFNEITKNAIKKAIEEPGNLDPHLYQAQQARRILDRLVGYKLSPLLWSKVRRGLSAGRVQSVALRIVCEREKEIRSFKSEEYWSLDAELEGSSPPVFSARLHKINGEKATLPDQSSTDRIIDELKGKEFLLKDVIRKERRRNPFPPFITSTLQQDAARKLGFSARRTMGIAQALYEGIEIGGEGSVGLITYMRTDSTRIADSAIASVRELVRERFGNDYLPDGPNFYKSKKGAQDAHEAIRPTDVRNEPDLLKNELKKDEYLLYRLIWQRFVACQMAPAVLDQTTFEISGGKTTEFRATGSVVKFPGFLALYAEGTDEGDGSDKSGEGQLPNLASGEILTLRGLVPTQHFTEPPPRFTEASLIKELEEKGIGRPSTYAAILANIEERDYVKKDEKRLVPTDLGILITDLLVESFANVMDVQFTARMEEELDGIEEGKRGMVEVVKGFYEPFSRNLRQAKKEMKNVKGEEIDTDISCEMCGNMLAIKWGKRGEFLACKGYPACRYTREFGRDEEGKIVLAKREMTGEFCTECGSQMIIKRGRFGKFLACSRYPECKNTRSIHIGVSCPSCGEKMVERKTRSGRSFFGCSSYPKCKFATWNRPVNEKCPSCGSLYLIEKFSKKEGKSVACPEKGCEYRRNAS